METYSSKERFGKLKEPWEMRSTKFSGILWICSHLNMTKSYLTTRRELSVMRVRRSFSLFQWSTLKQQERCVRPSNLSFICFTGLLHSLHSFTVQDLILTSVQHEKVSRRVCFCGDIFEKNTFSTCVICLIDSFTVCQYVYYIWAV